MGILLGEAELKKHGQEVVKLIPALVKDVSKIPKEVLNQKTELASLNEVKNKLEEEFSCSVEVEVADKSKEPKAKVANPGKPAILIE